MKLVEILARELSEWDSRAKCVAQDRDGSCFFWRSKKIIAERGAWSHASGCAIVCSDKLDSITTVATDHATAIVTREMWEAERARYHMKSQSGLKFTDVGELTSGQDIKVTINDGTEYIVHGNVDAFYPQSEIEPIYNAQAVDHGPITNRDRIRAIDAQLADLTLERAERIADLAAEGFALLPVVDAVDMEDWRNWQAGDLLEVVDRQGEYHSFNVGDVVTMLEHDTNLGRPAPYCKSNNGGYGWVRADKMKFHSRPKPC